MAGSPNLKIYHPVHGYIGCVKFGEDAAALASINGAGTTIRDGHSKKDTVWTEGSESFLAGESYDRVALLIKKRIDAKWEKSRAAHAAREAAAEIEGDTITDETWPHHPDGRRFKIAELTHRQQIAVARGAVAKLTPEFAAKGVALEFKGDGAP